MLHVRRGLVAGDCLFEGTIHFKGPFHFPETFITMAFVATFQMVLIITLLSMCTNVKFIAHN